ANQSYGLQVASLAGVPKAVIDRARLRLRELEDAAQRHSQRQSTQLSLFPLEEVNPAVAALRELDPDSLSPRQALELIFHLRELASTATPTAKKTRRGLRRGP
ncbi:MAG: DNA mismatch repair protein MutS, partial [Chromatiaceae bacterium]|nr:DNA mismatch repair protein MutS [Chromatiaceae bacterium]